MQFQSAAFILLSLGLSTTAAPAETAGLIPVADLSNSTAIESRGLVERSPVFYSVSFCQHANRGGKCSQFQVKASQCYNFNSWWNDRVSSIFTTNKAYCAIYLNTNCHGDGLSFHSPGINDLKSRGADGGKFNDQASSLKC
ncbi:beta gamma crystallin protein [Neofusicoccum parvum]|uniref:Beta gamma crystallin protein n=1 Tax=Neofusicoccum parvum TaxID=310453 RepID=A0ACB5S9C2_9PEZI|nr:beta gamma crystallin protein [Neofusicoccum parvum]